MDEKAGIFLCLQKIEEKLYWKKSEEWKDYEYNLLKKEIYAVSGLSISTHTLKRLFGKIKYKSDYSPQHATKDALAMYLGYKSWEEFLMKAEEEEEQTGIVKKTPEVRHVKKKKTLRRTRVLVYSLLVFIVCGAAFVIIKNNSGISNSSFSVNSREGIVPHTVTFEYDISKVKSDQVYIDFDFVHPDQGGEYILMDHEASLLNHTYQIPGVYYPNLVINNEVVATEMVVVKSQGWVAFHNNLSETTKYWLDNMFQDMKYNGYLTFTREKIAGFERDTTGVYYTTHRNIRDFGLSGDNFKFEMKFKNGLQNGGISCFDSRLTIWCENQPALIWMVEDDCHQFCRLKFGEKNFDGKTSDLSFLSRDLSNWTVLRVEVEDKNVTLFLDDKKVYSEHYSQTAGDIKGLQIRFKGSGMVDYMLMTNVKSDTVYYDDFN